jgi:hypothetical protein
MVNRISSAIVIILCLPAGFLARTVGMNIGKFFDTKRGGDINLNEAIWIGSVGEI